jgi:hypothetical protein
VEYEFEFIKELPEPEADLIKTALKGTHSSTDVIFSRMLLKDYIKLFTVFGLDSHDDELIKKYKDMQEACDLILSRHCKYMSDN